MIRTVELKSAIDIEVKSLAEKLEALLEERGAVQALFRRALHPYIA